MAGSKKWMQYKDDNDVAHTIQIDEGNGEDFGFVDVSTNATTGATDPYGALGLGPVTQMRYVNWRADDGSLSRRFWVGVKDHVFFLSGGDYTVNILSGGQAVAKIGRFTSAVGEKRKLGVPAYDTGLNEGDAT